MIPGSTARLFALASTAAAASLAGGLSPAAAQTPDSALWLGGKDYAHFRIAGEQHNKAEMAVVPLETPAGKTEGFRFTVREHCDDPIAIQASVENPTAATLKDTLSAHFFLRTVSSEVESGEGKVQLVLENAKTYEKSVQFPATAAGTWKEYNVPFAAKSSYAPGEARIIFRLGYQKQTVEIAGFEIRNYGPSVAVSSLPTTKPDLRYPGMEANASWRAAADARIEKIRKAPLTIQVVDKAGRAVAGATVEVRQTRHAFGFGTALSARTLLDAAAGSDTKFTDAVEQNFNVVTLENDLKWAHWDKDRETPVRAAQWLKEHDIDLRGHNMVWPGWRFLPPELKELQSKPDELRQAILHHVEEVGTAMRPYAALWDVVNEPFKNHDLMDILGEGILADIFRQAQQAAPAARLFLNDYGIVTGNGVDRAHQDNFEHTIRYLLDQHAPLQGIGMQGHFGQEFTPPERIYAILDRFAQFHLPIEMTEFTAQAEDRQIDADMMRDVMTIFFSHPDVDAFVFWGFYDGKSFEHKATLYDKEGQLTPVGKMYRDLVFHRWWTQEKVAAANGTAEVSGFLGRYNVSVTHGGATIKQVVELKPGGSTVKVTLE